MTDTRSLLAERERTHGFFPETAAIAQAIKSALRSSGSLGHVEAEALDLIATKLARIAAGNPGTVDHWTDIAGYAQLVVDHLAGPAPDDREVTEEDLNDAALAVTRGLIRSGTFSR